MGPREASPPVFPRAGPRADSLGLVSDRATEEVLEFPADLTPELQVRVSRSPGHHAALLRSSDAPALSSNPSSDSSPAPASLHSLGRRPDSRRPVDLF